MTALHHRLDPATVPVIPTPNEAHHRTRPLYQQRAKIGVTMFRDAAKL